MTIYGPDIYNGQAGLNLSRLQYASFVIAKTTEGTYYVDKSYQGWRRSAPAGAFAWYHFLTKENASAQVANTKANVGDDTLPGMLDVETSYGWTPTMEQILAYVDAAHAAGLRLILIYLPRWVWSQMGSPDLSPLVERGLHLVSSSYPGGQGNPVQIYPGDEYSGWQSYGGMTPVIAQFTDQALDAGIHMDYNAFLGSVEQLHALFSGNPTPITGGSEMNLTDTVEISVGFADRYPSVANPEDGFTAGAKIPVATLLEGAALRAVNNEHMLTQLVGLLANPAVLAAAIASHLSGGGGADEATLTQFIAAHLHVSLSES